MGKIVIHEETTEAPVIDFYDIVDLDEHHIERHIARTLIPMCFNSVTFQILISGFIIFNYFLNIVRCNPYEVSYSINVNNGARNLNILYDNTRSAMNILQLCLSITVCAASIGIH